MTRPTKDMTKTTITREQMLALLQEDEALRALLQATVQEVLEAGDLWGSLRWTK